MPLPNGSTANSLHLQIYQVQMGWLGGHQPQQPDMGLIEIVEHAQVDQLLIHLRADVTGGLGDDAAQSTTLIPHRGVLGDRQRTGEQLLAVLI